MLQRKYLNGVEILSVEIDKLKTNLKEIAKKIKTDNSLVSKIILFGSFSKNNYTPYSDIDIAIILKYTNKKFLERQDEFIEYFKPLPFDVNLVVYTEDEFTRMSHDRNSLISEIEKGIVLISS
ncbi:MAG: nucleotidyltransferase domain-containing protein [Candidatus Aenigmatarchaeota archaeon]